MNKEEINFKKIYSDKNDNEEILGSVYEYILSKLNLKSIYK
jgi:hypothetical protein